MSQSVGRTSNIVRIILASEEEKRESLSSGYCPLAGLCEERRSERRKLEAPWMRRGGPTAESRSSKALSLARSKKAARKSKVSSDKRL